MATNGDWRRLGPWLAFAAVASAYYPRFAGAHGLALYVDAARCLWRQQVLADCVLPFTYPPLLALLLTPLLVLPEIAQTVVWYVIAIGCAVVSCRLAERIALELFPGEWPARDLTLLRWSGTLLSLKFILAVFENQGYDLLALPLLLVGLRGLTSGRDDLAGLSFGTAAALKVTPLLLLPWLLLRRRFRAAAMFVVALVVLSILPDLFLTPQGAAHGYLVTWLDEIAGKSLLEQGSTSRLPFWDGVNPYNLSLRGTVAQMVNETALQPHFKLVLRLSQATFVVLVAVIMLLGLRSVRLIPVEACVLVIAMLMLSPMTSRTHFVNLVLPYFVLVAACLRDGQTRRLGVAVLVLSFVGCTGIPRDLVPRAFTDFMRAHHDIVAGTLVLLVYLTVIVALPRRFGLGTPSTTGSAVPAGSSVRGA